MSAEEENEFCMAEEAQPPIVDHFSNVKRAASIVGDLRASLRQEGFTREETFELVRMYWASELGAFD